MTTRAILLALLCFGLACATPESTSDSQAQEHSDPPESHVQGESFRLNAKMSEDDCVVVPRPMVSGATPYEWSVQATNSSSKTKTFELYGNVDTTIRGGSNPSAFDLKKGETYNLELKPSGSIVKATLQNQTGLGPTWKSNLQKKPHSFDDRPPIAVRARGLKLDYVDVFWEKYRVWLWFTFP